MITTGEMDIPDEELAKKLDYINERMPAICNVMDVPDHYAMIGRVPKESHNPYGSRYEDHYYIALGSEMHCEPKAHFGSHAEMQTKVMSGILMAAHMANVVPRPVLDLTVTDADARGRLYFESMDDMMAAVDAAANGINSPAITGRATLNVMNRRAQPPRADRGK